MTPALKTYYREKVRSILKDNACYRKVEGQRRGSLSHKRLYLSKFTDRIFTQKTRPLEKNYHIHLLVDCSGSMRWYDKMVKCSAAVKELTGQIQEICSLKITGFHIFSKTFKEYNEKLNPEQLEQLRIDLYNQHKSRGFEGNHDGYHVRNAVADLKKQSGEKILIVMSDGRPNCDRYPCKNPGCMNSEKMGKDLKAAVEEANKSGILTMGIGIKDSSVQNYYDKVEVIRESNQILQASLKLFSENIRRV